MKLKIFTLTLLTLFASNVISEEVKVPTEEVKIPAEEVKIPAEKAVIQFKTKLGIITFVHQKHADLSITQCITCHHDYKLSDSKIKPCHDCHLHKKGEVPKVRTVLHTRCIGCHEYTTAAGQHAGPLKHKCKLCHIKNSNKAK